MPLLARRFRRGPTRSLAITLLSGPLLFGAGWGLVGLCPGPAIASLSWGGTGGIVFILAMVAGMLVANPIRARIDQVAAA